MGALGVLAVFLAVVAAGGLVWVAMYVINALFKKKM